MAQKQVQYNNVSQTQLDAIKQSLLDAGITINEVGDGSGSFNAGHGYTIHFAYQEPVLNLVIDGGWLTMGMAASKLQSMIEPFLVQA